MSGVSLRSLTAPKLLFKETFLNPYKRRIKLLIQYDNCKRRKMLMSGGAENSILKNGGTKQGKIEAPHKKLLRKIAKALFKNS